MYTDGVSDVLAGADGCADAPIAAAIERHAGGGAPLLDAMMADVHRNLAERAQPDDLTLLTATVLGRGTTA